MRIWRLASFGAALVGAVVCGLVAPVARFQLAFQPMVTALSILAAAIFVRLNRGLPTIDWKLLSLSEKEGLTDEIVKVTRSYVQILTIIGGTLLFYVALATAGADWLKALPSYTGRILSAFVGGASALSIVRMAYVVWRDYDIVRLQRHVIVESARREASKEAGVAADAKVADMRAARIPAPPLTEPKTWN